MGNIIQNSSPVSLKSRTEMRKHRGQGGEISIIFYIFSILILVFAGAAYPQGLVVMAKKVSGELPLDPAGEIWQKAPSLEIPLAAQVMAKPRIYDSKIKSLSIRALHNTKDIAFLVEWADHARDASLDIGEFSDAVALEFPSSNARGKPHFAMGDEENASNIWYWKAAWQERLDGNKSYAAADDFAGGMQAGNPVSRRTSPVENINAQGFGSANEMEKAEVQNITGNGKWQSNKWKVVFKRALTTPESLNVSFKEGGVTPIAFAVWDGISGDRGGRKVVSTWYYVGLETEEKKTIYLYAVIALVAAAGIETGIIFGIRKKRRR